MSRLRHTRLRPIRRLGAAAACAVSSVAVFGFVSGGIIFDVTRGSSIGLILAVVLLLLAFSLAIASVGLALQTLVTARHRRLEHVIHVTKDVRARRDRAA